MAVIAVVTACNMSRVFAGRGGPVVTGTASSNDLGMVDYFSRSPDSAAMTVLADVCSLYVCQGLTRGFHTVVTAEAVADDADMVEVGRPPGIGRVAVITGIAAVDMGRMFARG